MGFLAGSIKTESNLKLKSCTQWTLFLSWPDCYGFSAYAEHGRNKDLFFTSNWSNSKWIFRLPLSAVLTLLPETRQNMWETLGVRQWRAVIPKRWETKDLSLRGCHGLLGGMLGEGEKTADLGRIEMNENIPGSKIQWPMNINKYATCPWIYRTNSIKLFLVMLPFVKGSVIVLGPRSRRHPHPHHHYRASLGLSPPPVSPLPLPPLHSDHSDIWQIWCCPHWLKRFQWFPAASLVPRAHINSFHKT